MLRYRWWLFGSAIVLAIAVPLERLILAPLVPGTPPIAAALAGDDDDDDGGDDDGGDDDDDGGGGSGGSGSSGSGSSGSSGGGSGDDDDDSSGSGSGQDGSDDDGSGSSGSGSSGSGDGDDDQESDDDARSGSSNSGRGRGRGGRQNLVDLLSGRARPPGDVSSGTSGRETASDALLAADLSRAEIDAVVGAGFRVQGFRGLPSLGIAIVRLSPPPGVPPAEAELRLRALAPARAIDVDHVYELQSGDCTGTACWGSELVGWEPDTDGCSDGLRLGMIDTAVDRAHPALVGATVRSRAFRPDGSTAAKPDHGTAIASLLVGQPGRGPAGLLPRAELLSAEVFGQRQGRPVTGALEIATALDWLVEEGADVVNASLAGPPNRVLELAVAGVRRKSVPIVAAAGNAGPDAAPAYPAAYPGVLAATAVDRDLAIYRRANQGSYVTFAAPGVDLPLALQDGRTRQVSGTSYAAVFLTAAVAGLRGRDIEATLAAEALDLGPPGRDPVFGWGLVRARSACDR